MLGIESEGGLPFPPKAPPTVPLPKEICGKARSWALSIGVPTNKLKNMQTSEFIQKFRHSWGITENYFENIQ